MANEAGQGCAARSYTGGQTFVSEGAPASTAGSVQTLEEQANVGQTTDATNGDPSSIAGNKNTSDNFI